MRVQSSVECFNDLCKNVFFLDFKLGQAFRDAFICNNLKVETFICLLHWCMDSMEYVFLA